MILLFGTLFCEQQDRRRTKEERELVARLRIFARFHSAADHEVREEMKGNERSKKYLIW